MQCLICFPRSAPQVIFEWLAQLSLEFWGQPVARGYSSLGAPNNNRQSMACTVWYNPWSSSTILKVKFLKTRSAKLRTDSKGMISSRLPWYTMTGTEIGAGGWLAKSGQIKAGANRTSVLTCCGMRQVYSAPIKPPKLEPMMVQAFVSVRTASRLTIRSSSEPLKSGVRISGNTLRSRVALTPLLLPSKPCMKIMRRGSRISLSVNLAFSPGVTCFHLPHGGTLRVTTAQSEQLPFY